MEKIVVAVNNQRIDVIYTNKKMKTRRLRVSQDGVVMISGYNMKREEIINFVLKNYNWIEKVTKEVNNKKQAINFEKIKSHDVIWVFGTSYLLEPSIDYSFSKGIITYPQKITKEKAFNYICNASLKYLEERVQYYSNIFDIHPKLTFKDMKSKYGYCMYKANSIVLSKRLIHYNKQIIDYVIVHEYCHFLVPNHSKEFYKEVEKVLPNYKAIIKELKEFNYLCKY